MNGRPAFRVFLARRRCNLFPLSLFHFVIHVGQSGTTSERSRLYLADCIRYRYGFKRPIGGKRIFSDSFYSLVQRYIRKRFAREERALPYAFYHGRQRYGSKRFAISERAIADALFTARRFCAFIVRRRCRYGNAAKRKATFERIRADARQPLR